MGVLRNYLFPNAYKYHDTPEGEDCGKKLWYITENCALYGVLGSSLDVLLFSHPKGYMKILGRYAFLTLPFIGFGATFVITTCMATNIRKKDDALNYAISGSAMGAVVGAWWKSIKVGSYTAIILAAAMYVKKDCYDRGWDLFTSKDWAPQMFGNFWSIKRDFSILQDPGKTWKTSADS